MSIQFLLCLLLASGLAAQDPASAKDIAAALGTKSKALDVRPSIALRVQFSLGGARLTPEGRAQLDELARALQSPELDGRRFLLSGHTDSKGPVSLNQRLSQRRADAAKRYLVDRYGIAPARLEAKGFGSSKLLLPETPHDERNRRVEVEALD